VKLGLQRVAVADDSQCDVGLTFGEVDPLLGRQDVHLDLGMEPRELGEFRH
jgi:hypothetical protein